MAYGCVRKTQKYAYHREIIKINGQFSPKTACDVRAQRAHIIHIILTCIVYKQNFWLADVQMQYPIHVAQHANDESNAPGERKPIATQRNECEISRIANTLRHNGLYTRTFNNTHYIMCILHTITSAILPIFIRSDEHWLWARVYSFQWTRWTLLDNNPKI